MMVILSLLISSLVLPSMTTPLLAALPSTKTAGAPKTPAARTVEQFRQNIKSHRSRKARQIGSAYDHLQDKEFAEAIAISTKLLNDDHFSDYANWISAAAYRGKAEQLLKQKNSKSAIASAQRSIPLILNILSKNPYSALTRDLPKDIAAAELIIASAHSNSQQWVIAQKHYERAFQRLASVNKLITLKSPSLGNYAESCNHYSGPLCDAWLQKLANMFSKKSSELTPMLKFFPDLVDDSKYPKPAFSRLTQTYKGPDPDQTAFESAMKFYFDQDYKQAARSFRLFLDNYPRSTHRFRVKFWLAQAMIHEKELDKAQKLQEEIRHESPFSFYGFLSASLNQKPVETNINETAPLVIKDTDPSLFPAEAIHLQHAQNFIAENAYDLASMELKELRPRDTLSSPFLAYLVLLNYEAKNFQTEFQLVSELIQRSYDGIFSSEAPRFIFPAEYLEVVNKFASQHNLDPILVLSLIKQESAFDEGANSSVGALGLMQLMPATAADMIPNIQISALLQAEENISAGTKYLRRLLNRYNGNIVMSLAAYNAGPGAVDRWLRDIPSKRNMMEFIESIPYKETREYVGSIIRNYFWYSAQLNTAKKDLQYFWMNPPGSNSPNNNSENHPPG